MTRVVVRTAAVVLLVAALLTGCLSNGSCSAMGAHVLALPAASASCASGVEYQDRFYVALSSRLPVARGERLGEAVYPVCNDTGDCDGDVDQGVPTQVWAFRGVDPDELVVAQQQGTDRFVVHAGPGVDPDDYFRLVDGRWRLRPHALDP